VCGAGVGLLGAALMVVVALAPIVAAAPIPGGSITTVCAGTTNGATFTLTADCGDVTTSLTVPPAITTVDGGGHIISATDVTTPSSPEFNGAVLTNAGPGQTMNIQNVTITGPATGFQLSMNCPNVLYGIFFNDAGGSVTNVTVQHIFQIQNPQSGSCQTGRAIRADALTAAHAVTITNTVVSDYQKSGFEARGSMTAPMTMNLSGSTAGPPHDLRGLIAQNAVSYVGASGTIANNEIHGSGDQASGPGGVANGTGVLLFGAHDVTVDHNTITGDGTDIGVSVAAGSTNNTISFNQIGRTTPDVPDPAGIGVDVGHPTSSATLICNTFTLWNTNIAGAVQISCTPLPNGTECEPYSTNTLSVQGGTAPYTWSVASGTLPPGLSLTPSDGAITGTPTQAGTFDFTVTVVDSTDPTLTATQAQAITIAPDCAVPTTAPPTTEPPTGAPTTEPAVASTLELPPTGANTQAPLYVGLAVLALGSLAVILTTRRRASRT
jgi:Putative Ig domain/Right handed beta helix region